MSRVVGWYLGGSDFTLGGCVGFKGEGFFFEVFV